MKTIRVKIDRDLSGKRVDQALVAADVNLSRKKIRAIIDAGGAYINDKRVRIASRKVNNGDTVRLEYNLETLKKSKRPQFAFTDADILYFKNGLIAVNKPPGLPSQATLDQSVMHVMPCLKAFFESKGEKAPNFTLVHRLDKETSGVLILGTERKVAESLGDLFRERLMEKTYHAISYGIPKQETFRVECYLSPIHKKLGLVKKVNSGGKPSLTDFSLISRNKERHLSLIKCRPKTGRSHQIRVHLDIAGYPIVGDKRYGNIDYQTFPKELVGLVSDYHFLHAESLSFSLPGVGAIDLSAEYPQNFREFTQNAGLITR